LAASSDDRGNERAGGGDSEQEERTDGWMATYSDMVTLLLTFFVLMFALSNVDNQKAQLFLFAMSRDGLTAEQFLEITEMYSLDDLPSGEWDDDMFPMPPQSEDKFDEEERESAGDRALRELAEAIKDYISAEGLGEDIMVTFTGDFLMLTLSNDVWFDSGSADVSEEMTDRASILAHLLLNNFHTSTPFEIVVAGHTDNIPIESARFPSNWWLSNARATNFMKLLIDESGLPPWYFYARSCGEYRPIASNDTPEGRQANRRVEVMISLARENPLWDNVFGNGISGGGVADENVYEEEISGDREIPEEDGTPGDDEIPEIDGIPEDEEVPEEND